MSNEELDSQLSAMFDDELPAPECELLARRLARDDALKARWGRYAAIGAALRMERGVRLDSRLAGRVNVAVAAEPSLLAGSVGRVAGSLASPVRRWWQPVAGAAVAAGVATVAILLVRAGSPIAPLVAQVVSPQVVSSPAKVTQPVVLTEAVPANDTRPDSYVVPPPSDSSSFAPPVELADFVVAHSEFSMPLLRRSALSALVAAESSADSGDAPDAPSDAGDSGAAASRSSDAAQSR